MVVIQEVCVSLVDDLKVLISELKEEELTAKSSGNQGMYSGLSYARVHLEGVLERNGYRRPTDISGEAQEAVLVLSNPG